jgi:chromosome segregation ATPase
MDAMDAAIQIKNNQTMNQEKASLQEKIKKLEEEMILLNSDLDQYHNNIVRFKKELNQIKYEILNFDIKFNGVN